MDLKQFRTPPAGYGEVAFFWWHGDTVTREKLAWILEQLRDSHISGLQINYAHDDRFQRGGHPTLDHEPRLFTPQWWELVEWFADQCREQGIAVSLSDYTLGTPGQGFYTDEILQGHEERLGQVLEYTDGTVRVRTVPDSINPMAQGIGEAMIRSFYRKFEEHFGSGCGSTVNFFFSDELKFNVRGRLWCDDFPEEFQKRKGYPIQPYLPALFEDRGDITPKIRLDYYDVVVQLSEERYFRPIYQWHQDRGMIFGCDHGGRGQDVTEFGDYFRAMRWYQGPGNDQPRLESNIIKNKVSSSIAHLYERPRTWLEGFYGSGWGTDSAQVADAVFRNFAMGHNLLSLHGLYYSTRGSMWEWAPPCNHYHMPYWPELKTFLACTERLSWLLSRGIHRSDVGIFYPVCAVEAEEEDGQHAVETAFGAARFLYEHGVDFDFVDFQSLQRAAIRDQHLCIARQRYKVFILPGMESIRFDAYRRLTDFLCEGGTVILMGDFPRQSDHIGRNDPELRHLNMLMRRHGHRLNEDDYAGILRILDGMGPRDFRTAAEKPFIQHRILGEEDLYYVYGVEKGEVCTFRTAMRPWLLDPWKGTIRPVTRYEQTGNTVSIPMEGSREELHLFLFSERDYTPDSEPPARPAEKTLVCEGEWECEILPTLDNTYGDYRLPPSAEKIGPEVWELRWCQTDQDCSAPGWDDSRWERGRVDCGPQLYLRDPDGQERAVAFSWRTGLPKDAGFQHSYHGLKGYVGENFLCLGKRSRTHFGSGSIYEGEGLYEVTTFCRAEKACTAYWELGEKKPAEIRLDGVAVDAAEPVSLTAGIHRLDLRYRDGGQTYFALRRSRDPAPVRPLCSRWAEDKDLIRFDAQPDQRGKPCWYRFTAPPGMQGLYLDTAAPAQVFADGVPMKKGQDGWYEAAGIRQAPAAVAIRILQTGGEYGCGAIHGPIRFRCGTGRIPVGEWSQIDGLRWYSGGILYRKEFALQAGVPTVLDLGRGASACRVCINGHEAATVVCAPYRVDLTPWVETGINRVEILVHNTLYNHMSAYPGAYANPAPSGLLGNMPGLKARLPVVNGPVEEQP